MNGMMTRRGFVVVAGGLAGAMLMGCDGARRDANAAWSFEEDDALPVLSTEKGSEAVMPVDCWHAEDGWIRLQLTGGSIPGLELDRVEQDGDTLTITLKASDGITTMDLRVFAWRLTPDAQTAVGIERVRLDRGDGDLIDLPQASA